MADQNQRTKERLSLEKLHEQWFLAKPKMSKRIW